MLISKTDYLEYTYCRKNLWLRKHKPELFKNVEMSDFDKKIVEDGNLAEAACRKLFPEGMLIVSSGQFARTETQEALQRGVQTLFQATFQHDVFYIRADILKYNEDLHGWELYEVKATNEVKRKVPHHHVNDLAFQKIVIEACGLRIVKASVIHLNREYRKHGTIRFHELFLFADLTNEIKDAEENVRQEMKDVKRYLSLSEEAGCSCVYEGRANHCPTFVYSNPQIPAYSVHHLNRIGANKKKLIDWIDRGIFTLDDIDNPEKLNETQKAQYDAYMFKKALINKDAIRDMLQSFVFPLQFFDYEAYSSAIPLFDGFGSYEHVPFQYSLHILHEDGEIEHKAFLITELSHDLTRPLVERMYQDFDPGGTVISWYKTYEMQRNEKLAALHPEYAPFLESLNERMFDLMTIFSGNYYVDPAFKGSTSIKKILPVLIPSLSYADMSINKGDQASERWEKMIHANTPKEEKEQIAKDLLEYCKLDTWAMVEIYRYLRNLG